ncbi:hypothetical protein lbkm_1435 [Lachnospiraceae bacterium KM106-2]|nr:hypothetical protein lbkm_1435 [Lachnospiraceae bacterium KM106-2]
MKKKLISLLLVVALIATIPAAHMSAKSVSMTKSFQNNKKFTAMVKDVGPWWMRAIVYDGQKSVVLTKKNKIQMAADIAVINHKYKSYNDGNKVIMAKKDLKKAYKDLFGTTWFSMKNIEKKNSPQKSTRTIYLDKTNKIHVNLGDWGDSGPSFKIVKVVKSGLTYTATIKMYMVGAMPKTLKGVATMKFRKNASSVYGYKMISLVAKAK